MNTQPADVVVVGVDGSDKDGRAVDWAADEAARAGTGLHALYSFPVLLHPLPDVQVAELGAQVTERASQRARSRHPGLSITTRTVVSDPATELVEASRRARAVVVGARGLGRIAGRLLGSVSQKVAAHAAGVVVIVRDTPVTADGPVVVGVDPAETAPEVLELAFTQAARRGVGVRLVYAETPRAGGLDDHRAERVLAAVSEQQSQALADLAQEWAARHPEVPVDVKEVTDHPVEALTEESAHGSLLVVGSRSQRGLSGLRLGSVARGVLHEAPVVAVLHLTSEAANREE